MTIANVQTTISNTQLAHVRDLKSFHDYVLDKMSHEFSKAVKDKMVVNSQDNELLDALEVEARVVIMSTEEYKGMKEELEALKRYKARSQCRFVTDTGGTWTSQEEIERQERERGNWGIFG
jgi:hypothetical protein